mmetsp:Transcript_58696/g.139865  ORF Transcript_58696/g.139865 Transcript_58696/m.139865 type:complete len:589 (-) Transcript_58696:184-1950(-)
MLQQRAWAELNDAELSGTEDAVIPQQASMQQHAQQPQDGDIVHTKPRRAFAADLVTPDRTGCPFNLLEQFCDESVVQEADRSISAISTSAGGPTPLPAEDSTEVRSPSPSTLVGPQTPVPFQAGSSREDSITPCPSRSDTASPAQERKIFVGGVPQDFSQEDLYDTFCVYGGIRKAWLQKCRPGQPTASGAAASSSSHNHRGFGFVVFQDRGAIDELLGSDFSCYLHLTGRFSGERPVEVKRALSNNKIQQSNLAVSSSVGRQSPPPPPVQEDVEPSTPVQPRKPKRQGSSAASPSELPWQRGFQSPQQSKPSLGNASEGPASGRFGCDAGGRETPQYTTVSSPVRNSGQTAAFLTMPLAPPMPTCNSVAQQSAAMHPQVPMHMQLSGQQPGSASAGQSCAVQVVPGGQTAAVAYNGALPAWGSPAPMARMQQQQQPATPQHAAVPAMMWPTQMQQPWQQPPPQHFQLGQPAALEQQSQQQGAGSSQHGQQVQQSPFIYRQEVYPQSQSMCQQQLQFQLPVANATQPLEQRSSSSAATPDRPGSLQQHWPSPSYGFTPDGAGVSPAWEQAFRSTPEALRAALPEIYED